MSMKGRNTMLIHAYAKINLTLDILRKRPDGYHDLVMIMQSVGLYDEVTVKLNDSTGIHVKSSSALLMDDESNTAYKAAKRFFEYAGISDKGAEIGMEKNIPMEAGMAGGSADAAAVIIAMNRLCGTHFSDEELWQIGEKVGADVPFCIKGGTALCEGIGEKLTPLSLPDGLFFAISKPDDAVSTPEAYKLFDLCGKPNSGDYAGFEAALKSGSVRAIGGSVYNAFTSACAPASVRKEIERLSTAGASGAEMTGSGSAVFGIFESKQAAELAANESPLPFSGVYSPAGNGTEIVR